MTYTLSEAYFDLYNPRVDSNFDDNLKFVEDLQKEDIEDIIESVYWELRDYGNTFEEAFDLIDRATDVEIMLEASDQIILEADEKVRVTYGGTRSEYDTLRGKDIAGGVFTGNYASRSANARARQRAAERASIIKNATKAVRSTLSGPIRSVKQAISGATGGIGRAKAAVSTGAAKMGGAAQEAKARFNQLLRKGVSVAGKKVRDVGMGVYRSGEAAKNAPARTREFAVPGLGKLNVTTTPSPTAGARRMAIGKSLRRAGAAIRGRDSVPGRSTDTPRATSTSAGVQPAPSSPGVANPQQPSAQPSVSRAPAPQPPSGAEDRFARFFSTRPSVATGAPQRPTASQGPTVSPRVPAVRALPPARTGTAAQQPSGAEDRFARFFSTRPSVATGAPQRPVASRTAPSTPSRRQLFLPPGREAPIRPPQPPLSARNIVPGLPRPQSGRPLLSPGRETYRPSTGPQVSRGTAEALRRQAQRRQDARNRVIPRGTPLLPPATQAVSRRQLPALNQDQLAVQRRRERLGIPLLPPAYEMPSPPNPRSGQRTPPSSQGRRPYGGPGATITRKGVPYSELTRKQREDAARMQRVSRARRETGFTPEERSAPRRSTEPVYGSPSWARKLGRKTFRGIAGDRPDPRLMRRRSRLRENFDNIIEIICEDMVNYGYATDVNNAVDVIENLSDESFDNLITEYTY